MNIEYKALARFLERELDNKKYLLIAIDGPGGSGKSFFTDNITKYLSSFQVIHFDDFYHESNNPNHHSGDIGCSFDWNRLENEVLLPISNGDTTYYQKYDWVEDQIKGKYQVKPEGIIIIEGVYSSRNELRRYFDIKIWIEVDYSIRLGRGVERDGEEMRNKWVDDWMPKEIEYIESKEHNPREHADIIICGNASKKNIDCVNVIENRLELSNLSG